MDIAFGVNCASARLVGFLNICERPCSFFEWLIITVFKPSKPQKKPDQSQQRTENFGPCKFGSSFQNFGFELLIVAN
jgi:hypothetical protein